jgi:hypothetical protein
VMSRWQTTSTTRGPISISGGNIDILGYATRHGWLAGSGAARYAARFRRRPRGRSNRSQSSHGLRAARSSGWRYRRYPLGTGSL